jgi:hypothetical protein
MATGNTNATPPKLRQPPTHERGAQKRTPARQAVELDISELTRISTILWATERLRWQTQPS